MTNKTNDSNQLSNYCEIASAIKKSIEASGRVPPHKSVGGVLYRFLCTVSGNDVTLRSNSWSATDWENTMTNASIKYTLTESEHVKWNNVQVAAETLLSEIVFNNKDDIFGLFLKWIKSEKETSMYTPSAFLPHGITETIKTHNESEKQKTFNLLRNVFKTNYDSTLVHIVNAMAEQPSTEDTFVALSEKAMAELLKHEAENIKLKAINSSLTAANNNLRHNDNNNPDILKITRDSVFNRLKGLFPDNKPEFIRLLAESFVDNKQTKNKYHVTDAAELFNKDADIYHYKNQIECLLHEAKVKSMKIAELEQQIADLHRKYTTPVITVGSVTPTTPKEPEFDSKTAIEHLRTLVTLQETRLQRHEQKNEQETNKESETLSMSETQPEEIKYTTVPEPKITNGELTKLYDRLAALESWLSVRIAEHTEMIKTYAERAVFHSKGMFSIVKVAKLPNGRIPNAMYLVGEPDSDKFDLYVTDMNGELRALNTGKDEKEITRAVCKTLEISDPKAVKAWIKQTQAVAANIETYYKHCDSGSEMNTLAVTEKTSIKGMLEDTKAALDQISADQDRIARNSISGAIPGKINNGQTLKQINKDITVTTNSLIHNVETLFMTLTGHRQIIDANIIARYSNSISDMFFAVERELAMRTDEAVRMLAHAGYGVNVSCTRMFQIGKDGSNLSFAFYDSIPVRSVQN